MLQSSAPIVVETWSDNHPHWAEFVECLQRVVPEQACFVLGDYYRQYKSWLFVALQGSQIGGFLRFAVQPIGPEAHCPPLHLDGDQLTEAKIHAFAVCPEFRGRGIGALLQKAAIREARALGCYQLASYSDYSREANYHVKLSLGFAVQPEVHGDDQKGSYFLMPLRVPDWD